MEPDRPETEHYDIRSLASRAKERAAELATQHAEAEQVASILFELERAYDHGWWCNVRSLLKNHGNFLARLSKDDPTLSRITDDLATRASDESKVLMRRFPTVLENAVKDGLTLDVTGRHPRYTFENGFFTAEIDEKRQVAKISDFGGRLCEIPSDPGAIVEKVLQEKRRIFGRPFDGAKLLALLRREYLNAIKLAATEDGTPVLIRRVFRRFSKDGVKIDEFAADLSRLLGVGPHEIDGRSLDFQHTREADQGILLHTSSGRNYVGYIVFRKAQP